MSATTKDRAKLGTTTYSADVYTWNSDNSDYLYAWSGEFDTLDEAKAAVEVELRKANDDAVWGTIVRGTYEDNTFHDDKYGTVRDAVWEKDDHIQWDCGLMVKAENSIPRGKPRQATHDDEMAKELVKILQKLVLHIDLAHPAYDYLSAAEKAIYEHGYGKEGNV
jgi:hypothetical protein